MIYTTYFAKLNRLPENVIPISICGKAPEWYKGLQYKKLAPKYDFFMKWKETKDNDYYIREFENQVLGNMDADETYNELMKLAGIFHDDAKKYYHIALVCYEKPTDFCHRHLVADWFKYYGYDTKELDL